MGYIQLQLHCTITIQLHSSASLLCEYLQVQFGINITNYDTSSQRCSCHSFRQNPQDSK
jgi:hypothetical protein